MLKKNIFYAAYTLFNIGTYPFFVHQVPTTIHKININTLINNNIFIHNIVDVFFDF